MAGTKLVFYSKVKASGLLEVVVAMVVIVMVFGLAMMIYANVTRMSLPVPKFKAQAILQEKLIEAEQNKNIESLAIDTAGFHIEQQVSPYNGDTLLNKIGLTAYDVNHQEVAALQKIVGR